MRTKKVLSVVLAVLICLTALIIPISSTALSKSSCELPVIWQAGEYDTNTGEFVTGSETSGNCICSEEFIDISKYSLQAKINFSGDYTWEVFYYDENQEFLWTFSDVSSSSSTSNVFTVGNSLGTYMKIVIYKNGITVSDGDDISITSTIRLDPALIKSDYTGQLTIHKYEMKDKEISAATTVGTGYTSDENDLPTNAKAINNVTFEVTRVATLDSNYYTPDGIDLPTPTEAAAMITTNSYKTTQTTRTIDNKDGLAVFEDLPLGIYLVHEKNAPPHITKSNDFVVSLPVVNNSGDGWKYDVDVYPKNASTYADVIVKKVDADDNDTTLEGAKFNVYQSETENEKYSKISTVTTGNDGTYRITELKVNHYYVLEETSAPSNYILDNADNNNKMYFYLDENGCVLSKDKNTVISTPTFTPTEGSKYQTGDINRDGSINAQDTNLILHYISGSAELDEEQLKLADVNKDNAVNTKDTTGLQYYVNKLYYGDYPAIITIENTKPAIEKYIDKSRGNNSNLIKGTTSLFRYDDNNDYNYYVVNVKTPQINNMSTLKTFKVTDTIKKTIIAPTINKIVKVSNNSVLSSSAYTFKAETESTGAEKDYTTELDFDTSKLESNTEYYISYKAYIANTTKNQATLTYSNRTTSDTDNTYSIDSNEVCYQRYGVKISKQDPEGNVLQGAKFQVFASEADARERKNPLKGINWALSGKKEWESNASGETSVCGAFDLGDGEDRSGTFWIVETKAPTVIKNDETIEYNLLADPIRVTIDKNSAADTKKIIIKNSPKLDFPLTGSIGMIIVLVVGVVFLGVAILLVVRKKRMQKQN